MRIPLAIALLVAACGGEEREEREELAPGLCADQMVTAGAVLFALDQDALWRVPLNGVGAPTRAGDINLDSSALLVQDDGYLYVNSVDEVVRVPKSGGSPEPLYAARPDPSGLTITGATLFWREGTAILEAPAAGGAVSTAIADAPGGRLAADADRVYWTSGPELWSATRAGGVMALVGTAGDDLRDLAVDESDVWATIYNDEDEHGIYLVRFPKAGGDPQQFFEESFLDVFRGTSALVVTSTEVFWAGSHSRDDTRGAYAIAKGGGSPRVVVSGLQRPGGLAVDEDYVYVADRLAPCEIWRTPL